MCYLLLIAEDSHLLRFDVITPQYEDIARAVFVRAFYNNTRYSHFAQRSMNCYAEIFNDIDLELNKIDQIHYL